MKRVASSGADRMEQYKGSSIKANLATSSSDF